MGSDGLQQHFNALLYYRSWLLSILDTLVTEHKVSVPLWDMQIGLGSDVLTTLHYYVIGDPLNLYRCSCRMKNIWNSFTIRWFW